MSARDALSNALWDNYTVAEKNAFIDAHRDEVALEIGRDALRDGLAPTLTRLVGEANAAKLMADLRDAAPAARHCGQQRQPHGVHLWESAEGAAGAVTGLWYCPGGATT